MKTITYKVNVTYDNNKLYLTEWYNTEGQLHREDGPAVEYASGYKEYYLKGQLHREDGPAIENANGSKYYYLNGKEVSEKKYLARNNKADCCDGLIAEIKGVKYRLTMV